MSSPVDPGRVRLQPDALTADEVRAATFRQSPLGWRGYSEDDVQEFLERVATALEAVERDNSALRTEVERLRSFYRDHGTDVDRVAGRTPARHHPSPLVREVDRYSDTLVDVAAGCADSTAADDAETCERDLYHARVRARVYVEDLISSFLSDPHTRSRADDELRLVARWMRGFGEALLAQVDAMVLVADNHLRSPAAWR
ncbi:DivIVA domain-containing protein [Planosporangium thailandense]|uniref:Cell wall synthesis protein Wag31 n=1 Tax=Planosporangium thailandense TaxID=765197 RepID=A0ABX0Y2F2_9ACTN|nr:DivIVA domain-containing protein [Planosporangium thailandense]NJC72525.1 DivIVA domain-containing protein [Planosporangium thailandense]